VQESSRSAPHSTFIELLGDGLFEFGLQPFDDLPASVYSYSS
jgi:hypothetical protein